jgi:hypothetical protein
MWPKWEKWLYKEQTKRFRHWNPKTMPDSQSKSLKCLPARRSQRYPGAPAPQGQAAIVWLFGTDCSDYNRSGQSKLPEWFPLFSDLHYDTPACRPFSDPWKINLIISIRPSKLRINHLTIYGWYKTREKERSDGCGCINVLDQNDRTN